MLLKHIFLTQALSYLTAYIFCDIQKPGTVENPESINAEAFVVIVVAASHKREHEYQQNFIYVLYPPSIRGERVCKKVGRHTKRAKSC